MKICRTKDQAIKLFQGRSRKSDSDMIKIKFKKVVLSELYDH